MKRNFVVFGIVALILVSFGWYGCKKDTTPPSITLNGDNPVYVSLGAGYTDAGATAYDNTDGTITNNIASTGLPVNTNLTGTYTITYNVSDKAGNAASEVTRTVIVQNDAMNYAGIYHESTLCVSMQSVVDTITASTTVNNQILITYFGLNAAASITANISSNIITIPSQTVGNHVYWGTGTISQNAQLVISYSDSLVAGSTQTCQSVYSK